MRGKGKDEKFGARIQMSDPLCPIEDQASSMENIDPCRALIDRKPFDMKPAVALWDVL